MKISTFLTFVGDQCGKAEEAINFYTSIFTDAKGHQGDIVRQAGGLIWLNALYGVDLNTNDYDTGFDTDLHALATQIMQEHDPNYKQ